MSFRLPDEELARRAAAGRLDGFEELLGRYRDRVYRICYRSAENSEDAEDWAQECFIRTYRYLHRYDPQLPFEPWLLRIVYNTCVNLAKSRSRRLTPRGRPPVLEITHLGENAELGQSPDPLDRAVCAEEERQALRAVEALPPDMRMAVVLRVLEDLSFREVGEVLGVPLQTAASRVRRALDLIRKEMGEKSVGTARRTRGKFSGRPEVGR